MSSPRDAEITVVGGGAIGAAVAYFLARDGRRDIQLLERRGLCEATSSQAAGLVGQARPTAERARLTMAAADIYRTFERDTGYTMDYKECGAVRLALSETSVRELQQIADTAAVTGLPVEFLSPARLREVYPVLERTDSVKAAWSARMCRRPGTSGSRSRPRPPSPESSWPTAPSGRSPPRAAATEPSR
jgi:glycine/D-amino acid oxidase-like deaminating enzyme